MGTKNSARVVALAAVVSLAACAGTAFEWSKVREVKVGMTTKEVEALLGAPYATRSSGGVLTYIWSHASVMSGQSRSVSVVFQDGRVVEVPQVPDAYK